MKTFFLIDVFSTFPCLIAGEGNISVYWCKIIRYLHLGDVLKLLNSYLERALLRIGVDKQVVERLSSFLNLILYLVYVVHILACGWTLIGYMYKGSWITVAGLADTSSDDSKDANKSGFRMNSIYAVYIRAMYFTVTTLTTVGYGDFHGYTNAEYLYQMALEFIGIAFFSLLMSSINNIIVQESKLSDILDEKIDELDVWLRKLDQARQGDKNLSKPLYDSIKNYVEASFLLDFSQIDTSFEFFRQMKPKLRHKMVKELFGSFIRNFSHMFEDADFEAGNEFVSDFITSLQCRIYQPGTDIVQEGEKLSDLFLIYKGYVQMAVG